MEGQQQNSSGAIVVAGLPQTLLIPWHRISSYVAPTRTQTGIIILVSYIASITVLCRYHEAATTTVGHALSYIKVCSKFLLRRMKSMSYS